MKKYITITTLLAAGSAFANAAEEVNFNVVRNDTSVSFNLTDVDLASLYTLTYTSWSYSGEGGNSTGFKTPESSNYANTFSPDGQLRSATDDSWTMNFTFTNNGTDAIVLGGFVFDCYGINGDGSNKNTPIPVTLTLSRTVNSVSAASVSSCEFNLGGNGEIAEGTLSFGAGGLEVSAGSTVNFALTMGGAKNFNTYSGIKSGSFTLIPEPSAFGLLAGLGALALVGSRRRRR